MYKTKPVSYSPVPIHIRTVSIDVSAFFADAGEHTARPHRSYWNRSRSGKLAMNIEKTIRETVEHRCHDEDSNASAVAPSASPCLRKTHCHQH
ncbi:hypothetical protein Y032_0090g2357 [Ancylostoma ceylanicum]|nr:hypothetical protein Y032_0090g2357 [Ancylostoma ceylanicum]